MGANVPEDSNYFFNLLEKSFGDEGLAGPVGFVDKFTDYTNDVIQNKIGLPDDVYESLPESVKRGNNAVELAGFLASGNAITKIATAPYKLGFSATKGLQQAKLTTDIIKQTHPVLKNRIDLIQKMGGTQDDITKATESYINSLRQDAIKKGLEPGFVNALTRNAEKTIKGDTTLGNIFNKAGEKKLPTSAQKNVMDLTVQGGGSSGIQKIDPDTQVLVDGLKKVTSRQSKAALANKEQKLQGIDDAVNSSLYPFEGKTSGGINKVYRHGVVFTNKVLLPEQYQPVVKKEGYLGFDIPEEIINSSDFNNIFRSVVKGITTRTLDVTSPNRIPPIYRVQNLGDGVYQNVNMSKAVRDIMSPVFKIEDHLWLQSNLKKNKIKFIQKFYNDANYTRKDLYKDLNLTAGNERDTARANIILGVAQHEGLIEVHPVVKLLNDYGFNSLSSGKLNFSPKEIDFYLKNRDVMSQSELARYFSSKRTRIQKSGI